MHSCTLDQLAPGQSAHIGQISAAQHLRRRLLDLGFTEGASARCLFAAPCGDPQAYWIRGAIIALRREDAAGVSIST